MIDVDKCVEEFLNTTEVSIYSRGDIQPHKEQITRDRDNMMVLTFNNGNGVAVIDTERFNQLPKSKQNKFFKLCK